MKQGILLWAALTGGVAMAQTMTIDDTLSIGITMDYYVADSNAVTYDAITGVGVTWDYSTLQGYSVPTNTNTVIDGSTSTFASYFPTSAYSEDFQNGIKTFFSYSGSTMIVDGFVFQESSNDFIIQYDNDPLIGLQFPMSQGDSYTDNIDGNAEVLSNTIPLTGSATVSADGTGTLLLAGNTYTNILRIKTVEITSGTTPPPLSQPMTVTRTVYAYYDLANFELPIFIHGTIEADIGVLGAFGYTSVYSKDPLVAYIGTEEVENEVTFSVYPNPATDQVTITTDKADNIIIYNTLGVKVLETVTPATTETIDISALSQGVYFVEVRKGSATRTQKLVIR